MRRNGVNIADTTILITGASQGIGRHLAVHFSRKCAGLVLMARNQANIEETARLVRGAGGCPCDWHVSDLSDADSLVRLVEDIKAGGKKVHLLINNAADVTSLPLMDSSLDQIDGLIRTNVTGCLQLCRLIAPMMLEAGGGMIVNTSSLAGYKPNPAQTVYSVSKAAVNAISDAVRAELGPKGIRVMNLAVPGVATNGTPKPGQMTMEAFAARLEKAIARDETELFFSPVTKWLMRLYKFCPALARLR